MGFNDKWDRFQYTEDDGWLEENKVKCEECGAEVDADKLVAGLCPQCQQDTVKEFRHYLYKFTETQREFLNTYYDGNEIA